MKFEPFLVKIIADGRAFSGYGIDGESPAECAKRILSDNTGIERQHIVFVSFEQNIRVSDVPEEVSCGWPKGAITIPCYTYTIHNSLQN